MDDELGLALAFLFLCLGVLIALALTGQSPIGSSITGEPITDEMPWYFRADYFFISFIGIPVAGSWLAWRLLHPDGMDKRRRWKR